jgi:RNA polymerase sigma factor FliA
MSDDMDVTALIEEHLPLVKHVVFQVAVHFPRHIDRDELADAGALGLVEAAQRYEAERGVPFERYAAQRIRGAILDSVRAADWAPRSVRSLARKLEMAEHQLANHLRRSPTDEEIAAHMEVDMERLGQLQHRVYRSVVLALDHYVAPEEDEELTLIDVLHDADELEPAQQVEHSELRGYLRDAIRLLPERHRLVAVGYFLEGRTSLELARFLGVTESRISQLRSEALTMLKDGIEAQYEGESDEEPDEVTGRIARRKARYAAAISDASAWRNRLVDATDETLDLTADTLTSVNS